jgi:hypothetical protein
MATLLRKLNRFYGATVELPWQRHDNLFMKHFCGSVPKVRGDCL